MPWLAPLLAAITGGVATIWEKIALERSRISWRIFLVMLFFWLFALTIILYPFLGSIKTDALRPLFLALILIELIVALVYNFYYYRSMEHQNLNEIEVAAMTSPVAKILLAAIVFPGERNLHVFLAAIIAALALVFAHIERRHLQFDKYSIGMVIYVILFSIEALLVKELLNVWSPVALYSVRCLVLFLIFAVWFRPKLENISNPDWWSVIKVTILAVPMMLLSFYGYHKYGVIYTTLILLLMPLIVFAGSKLVFKERMNKRMIIAAIIIIGAIVYVNIMG
jgi:drug/metabolite transporter (DMT)-like permease